MIRRLLGLLAEPPLVVAFERRRDDPEAALYAVQDDDSEVVRHAAPIDERARAQIREQHIAGLRRDDTAVRARERRIAIACGRVTRFHRRTG